MIKLILCDLDGTLFDKQKNISELNVNTIKNLKDAKFVVATGRPVEGVKPVIEKLGLIKENDYCVCYNGTVIYENSSLKPIYKSTIKGDFVKKVFKFGIEHGTNFHAFLADGTLITNQKNPYTAVEERLNKLDAEIWDIENISDKLEFIKCMLVYEKEVLDHIMEIVPEDFLKEANMVRSAGIYLEFLNKESSKGHALDFLKNYLNLKDDETMAIGDAHNDKLMLENAHIGVAMKNSFPCLFDVCDYITDDNESSGVAKALIHYKVS